LHRHFVWEVGTEAGQKIGREKPNTNTIGVFKKEYEQHFKNYVSLIKATYIWFLLKLWAE